MIATTPYVNELLAANSPVAIGVSGGKDSCAVAFATIEHLDRIGHTGPRVLIHSDLGLVEWQDSAPTCKRLARALGLELIVVRRAAGGMMERWETRWMSSVRRYKNLECVKLILPWSTASMRFCTSELKTAPICAELIKRFPGQIVLSVSGIRRDESAKRKKSPVIKCQAKLTSKKWDTSGHSWNPLLDWSLEQTFAYLESKNFPVHEAYTKYGCSRVSCAFCILGSRGDLVASATCEANQPIYRRMVDLELKSTFSFQEGWLCDVAPHLLRPDQSAEVSRTKERSEARERIESVIPEHLLYVKGWPTCIPTQAEAELLCDVRRNVSRVMEMPVKYTDPASLIGRYQELMDEKNVREEKAAKKAENKKIRASAA